MNRVLLAGLFVILTAVNSSAADKPNILWLTSEDHGPEMGCCSDELAVTPTWMRWQKECYSIWLGPVLLFVLRPERRSLQVCIRRRLAVHMQHGVLKHVQFYP